MKESNRSSKLRKTKRNFSDVEGNFALNRDPDLTPHSLPLREPTAHFIKINRSKLPADFFPRSESLRRKPVTYRPSFTEEKAPNQELFRRAISEREDVSPDKTSFFGFFSENDAPKKINANTLNLKRKFESREEPKRQKIPEGRKFTPMTGVHRADLLNLFPSSYDSELTESIVMSARARGIPVSRRPQQGSIQLEGNRNYGPGGLGGTSDKNDSRGEGDIKNITFFNSKSHCLPPINQNKG